MEAVITEEIIARQTPEAQAIIRLLLAKIAALEARIEELQRQVKGNTPQNSSLPPSTQHPHARPQPPKRKSKKKRGGQPGHEKHERPLIPSEHCDDVQPLKPTECRRCGAKLSGNDADPLRHQVWELPKIKPHVSEYQRHRLCCPCCGETTCAELPAGVPQGQSGPRLMAFTALLMSYYRQSKRRTAEFLGTLLGQPCCPSLAVKMQTQVTAAVRPSYEELAAELPTQDQLSIDETPTKEENGKAWLWTFVARKFTVFAVRATREATALNELLGDTFRGVVTCDRAKMYWRLGRLQWCWAHLIRDFQAMIDSGDRRAKRLGCACDAPPANFSSIGPTIATLRFRGWRCSVGWLPFDARWNVCCCAARTAVTPSTQGTCRELYEHRDWLWTFLRHEGVEPTNNASERSLRHAVIWRKLSFGTQSAGGSRFVETMLTVIETCRQQQCNAFSFLTAAVEAHLAHQSAPSLLSGV